MTQEKTRLKFKVTSHGVAQPSAGSSPLWTEKWGVGLFDYEEFHVTDQLLKLPFLEPTPKTVCVFSIANGALAFRHVDTDRRCEVNGVPRREAIVSTGDKIRIGETITIEISLAPEKARSSVAGPSLAPGGREPTDGPTLTLTSTSVMDPKRSAADGGRELPPAPVFEEHSKSVEVPEPSFNSLGRRVAKKTEPVLSERAAISSGPMPGLEPEGKVELQTGNQKIKRTIPPRPVSLSAGPMPGFIPDTKVELRQAPSVARDKSLESRLEAFAETSEEEPVEPVFAEEVDLASRPTLGERIYAAIARILRRDDLRPVEEPFPAEDTDPAKPWIPEGMADPGIQPARAIMGKASDRETLSDFERPEPTPWIPAAVSRGSRLRGRAFIFLVAAIGALMIAVGVFRIQYRVATLQSSSAPEIEGSGYSKFTPNRGIPISIIEEKVRQMRPPPPNRRR